MTRLRKVRGRRLGHMSRLTRWGLTLAVTGLLVAGR
jgi:hypothetical protein